MIILYSKFMRLFVGSEFLVSHRGLRKPRHFYGLSPLGTMSDHNWKFFHPKGIYPFLLIPDTFSVSCNRATLLDFVPFTEPTQSTPNAVSIYQPCTHTHEMRCFPCTCNTKMSLPVISCYMYNEHYMKQFITHTLCQVPWIIISKTYNLHSFMLIYITPIYQYIYNTFSML